MAASKFCRWKDFAIARYPRKIGQEGPVGLSYGKPVILVAVFFGVVRGTTVRGFCIQPSAVRAH